MGKQAAGRCERGLAIRKNSPHDLRHFFSPLARFTAHRMIQFSPDIRKMVYTARPMVDSRMDPGKNAQPPAIDQLEKRRPRTVRSWVATI